MFYKEVMEIIKNQVFRQLEWPKFGLREKYVPVDEAHRICIVIDSDVRSHVEAFQMYRLCAGGIYIPSMILGFPAEEEIILKIENGDELFLTSDDNIGLVIIKARIDEQRPTPKQLESFIKDVTRKGYGIKTTGSGNSDCGLFRGKVVLLDENVLEGGPSRKLDRKSVV